MLEAEKQKTDSSARFVILLTGLLILSAAAYVSLALGWTKFSRAEVFFAECVREMFEADNLVTPLYHGTPFFDKPILTYWFIAASYKVAGINHFAARIPSVIMALSTVAITSCAGRYLFGFRQGILAGAVLASSLMFMSFANLCMSDMTLVFFDTLSLSLLFLSLIREDRRSVMLYLASLAMGLAFLTKGPVGIVLPALSFVVYLTVCRQWKKIRLWRDVLPCALILMGAGVPWFMAAFRQNGAGALSYFFIHENLERFAASTYDTHRPLWFMVQSLASGMLPWSIFIPFAFCDFLRLAQEKPESEAKIGSLHKQIYLWLWIVVVIGFFSLSRGKIDYYALPVYPAAAILVGNYLTGACIAKARVAIIAAWLASVLFFAAGIGSGIFLPEMFAREGIACWQVFPAILLVCALPMLYFTYRTQIYRTFIMLFVSICMLAIAFSCQIYPWITSKQAVLKYIPYIRTLEPNGRVGVYASLQNWIDEITYQTAREPMRIDKVRMAEQFLKARCPCLLLMQESEYAEMSKEARQNCRVIASNPFIPRSLNPIYFIKKGQKLADKTRLLLISNSKPKDRLHEPAAVP